MEVDSFRYLSPLIKRYYQLSRMERELPIPFTPLRKPLPESRFGLVTSGGLYHRGHDRPFDADRERREPAWGDPSFRVLPADMDPAEVGVIGHILGRAHDRELQRRVILRALDVLEGSAGPGEVVHFQEPWPEPMEAGRRASHAETPPPIAAQMGRHIGHFLMGLRRRG